MGILAVLLLLAGLTVLVVEVFVPSGGMLAIITTVLLCLSVSFAYGAWFRTSPIAFWGFVFVLILLVPTTLGSAFSILPRTPMGKRALLQAPELARVEPFADEAARLQKLVGKFGTTVTQLNPGGMVLLDGERLHGCSEGMMIDSQTSVEVLGIRGTRVVVRPGQLPPALPGDSIVGTNRSQPDGIDFELTPE